VVQELKKAYGPPKTQKCSQIKINFFNELFRLKIMLLINGIQKCFL
jgi:hypothetical protein